MKKTIKIFSCFSMVLFSLSFINIKAVEKTYTLFPTPHNLEYVEGNTDLGNEINIVKKEGVSESTLTKLKQILNNKTVTVSEQEVATKKNIILGLESDATLLAENNVTVSNKGYDAYTLIVKNNKVSIIGKNDNAVFWGIETLNLMLEQSPVLRNVIIKDYADVKYRGFIEGYYGIPWSHENRISLMNFGGKFKANTYIFAPKDDIYHSSHWKELYPETELVKIRELAKVGNETRTKFVWTIHPFMSKAKFNFANYETDIATLKAKFEQLYANGVRQFGILADDVGSISRDKLLMMLNDVSAWAKSKKDVDDILFCPAGYNHAWQGIYSELKKLNLAPDNVQFFWTGDTVVGKVTKKTVDHFKTNSSTKNHPGRDPFIWFNWPVNDYKKSRLLMGDATSLLEVGVENLAGLVTNPMQQAQASKVGIFATIDYGWNTHDFNGMKNWENAFKEIEPVAHDALKQIAYHLQSVEPSGHGLILNESANISPLLEQFNTVLENNEQGQLNELGNSLIAEHEKIITAVDTFSTTAINTGLKDEMNPWLNALSDLAMSNKYYLQALLTNDFTQRWDLFERGNFYGKRSKTYTVQNISSKDIVEAGTKHLVPFNNTLAEKLDRVIYPTAEAEQLTATGFYSDTLKIRQNDIQALTDENQNSFVSFSSTSGDYIVADGYVGIKLSKPITLGEIVIKQGRPQAEGDHFGNSYLEYSLDGKNYTLLQEVDASTNIDLQLQQNIKAQYVRIRNKAQVPVWASFKTFEVKPKQEIKVITNVEKLKLAPTSNHDNTFSLLEQEVTLQPNEYIGLDLLKIREVSNIKANENLTLEYSKNDVVYHELTQTPNLDTFRYVRLINKTNAPITTRAKIKLNTIEYQPIRLSDTNYTSYENVDAAFDGDLNTAVWLKNSQNAGKFIVYDLGKEIDLKSIKMIVRDSEHDFIRHGKIAVSLDKHSWEDVLTINATSEEEIATAFPTHNISVNEKENHFDTKKVRYLKVELTQTKTGPDKWVRFQEIVLNDGEYIPSVNNPQIVTPNLQSLSNKKEFVDDHLLTTAFKAEDKGELIYYIDHPSAFKAMHLLTSGNEKMNVMIMNEKEEWIDKGTLDSTYKTYNLNKMEHALALKLTWDTTSRNIHELIFDNNMTVEDFEAEMLGVKVFADKTVLDNSNSLVVKEVEMEIENAHTKAYDIKIFNANNEKAVFNGEVEVKIPLPSEFDAEKVQVFHEQDKEATPHTIEDGYVVFKATSFSVYYLKQEVNSANETNQDETSNSVNNEDNNKVNNQSEVSKEKNTINEEKEIKTELENKDITAEKEEKTDLDSKNASLEKENKNITNTKNENTKIENKDMKDQVSTNDDTLIYMIALTICGSIIWLLARNSKHTKN